MNVMTSVAAEPRVVAVPAGSLGFSADEYWRMAELGAFRDMWVELVGGELKRMPPPGKTHGRLQLTLATRLSRIVPEDRLFGEVAVRLSDDSLVGCDAAILRAPSEGDGAVLSAEVLVVAEVAVSTIDHDLAVKRRLYATAGIPTYWVVDAAREVVHVFDRPVDGDYAGLSLVRFGEPLAVPGTDETIAVG